ncbi:MAG: hypothetical protein U5J83_10330 [Bryobacterales bacterium]|nr:hypothetical protein [Bryobacterales bacterium]
MSANTIIELTSPAGEPASAKSADDGSALWTALNAPKELVEVFRNAPSVTVFSNVDSILQVACG